MSGREMVDLTNGAGVVKEKIRVAVLGATGSVGQRFVALLAKHPWFELVVVAASERSVGKRYDEAARWAQARPLPSRLAALPVQPCAPPLDVRLVFSALDAAVAGSIEEAFARAGCLVVSNASSHRLDPAVPLLIPEVNPTHLGLIEGQPFGAGAIITNPNCSTIGLVMALAPLQAAFGLAAVQVVTLQAVSGAGLRGVSSMEMVDNIVPFIRGEEQKIETEALKILGAVNGGAIEPASFPISAQCTRVAVIDGHTECVSVKLEREATLDEVSAAWSDFSGEPQERQLPGAPLQPVHVLTGEDGPQPRLHRNLERGMAVSVGRLRTCNVLDIKFVTLSHNTVRGAAGGSILAAELAVARGLLST